MKSTKKSLIFSALSLLLCCALLAGTTFAWFTDSVTNTGNIITAGNLAINAYAYDIGEGGESFTITGVNNSMEFTFEVDAQAQDLKEENCPPIISDDLWEPVSYTHLYFKRNNVHNFHFKHNFRAAPLYLSETAP